MHALDNTTSSRSVMTRRITPWEYRHLRAFACGYFAAGGFTLGVGLVLVSLGRGAGTGRERRKCFGWAAWFLLLAALTFTGGFRDLYLDRSTPPRI
ncbi:MAG TPA: hypothetical protein VHY58_19160 [Streptosporangiaceae bacterium]|nr:hypothetical protein [Streptosporangiaceae bacterium]